MTSVEIEEHRKSLLPRSLRKMSKVFMISGILSFLALILLLVVPLGAAPAQIPEISFVGLSVSSFLGLASYGLLRGKSWGVHLGMFCGILVIVTPAIPRGDILQLASLAFIRVPYVYLLLSTRRRWKSAAPFPLSKAWWLER